MGSWTVGWEFLGERYADMRAYSILLVDRFSIISGAAEKYQAD